MSSQSLTDSRQRILNQLERAMGAVQPADEEPVVYPDIPIWSTEEKIERLKT